MEVRLSSPALVTPGLSVGVDVVPNQKSCPKNGAFSAEKKYN